MYEAQMAQIQQQTFNMESAALATDNLRNTMATVDAMKIANKELKKQYGKIDIDKIEVELYSLMHYSKRLTLGRCLQSIHYDMEDLLEQANEIQESLSRSYAVPDELDEADLEAGKRPLNKDKCDINKSGCIQNLMLWPLRKKKRAPPILQILISL